MTGPSVMTTRPSVSIGWWTSENFSCRKRISMRRFSRLQRYSIKGAQPMRTILVTGGAGFIGSAVCRYLARDPETRVVNVDKLTYAGNLASLRSIENQPNYSFHKADICDEAAISAIMHAENIDAVMHLAAESHVDRSIDGPGAFIETNIVGTYRLLNAALEYWRGLPLSRQEQIGRAACRVR